MTEQERELDIALAEAEAENRLLRARNERLELELAAERENCAKIADAWVNAYPHPSALIAKTIRARGQA